MSIQRQKPFRPRSSSEISQGYNDGIVTIFYQRDGAASGYLPSPSLTAVVKLAYQERKLGIKRYYDAKQNQINVERVIRVPMPPEEITSQDVAVTETGTLYRIDLIQMVKDVYPPSLDLTLALYAQGVANQLNPIPLPPINEGGGSDV